jgi:hypothetical protein
MPWQIPQPQLKAHHASRNELEYQRHDMNRKSISEETAMLIAFSSAGIYLQASQK